MDIRDIKTIPDPFYPYTPELRNNEIPIIIDNGSYNCRAGWATNSQPNLIFKNLLARPRKDRGRKEGETQIGNDIVNIEAVRFQLKTQFDRNVVTQFEVQEQIFDYLFLHLSIDTDEIVNHPIIITEAFLNPNYSRILMSELLFEGYHVPGICYGIDSLFSYIYDNVPRETVLIVSVGYHCTHVIPVINGKVDTCRCKRIDVGGYHITYYLHKLLQLKYPAHMNAITLSRAEALVFDHGFITTNYQEEVDKWADGDYYDQYVKRIQLPYNIPISTPLTPDQQREKRKELAKKLVEINARKREEKLVEDEEKYGQLSALQEMLVDVSSPQEIQSALRGFQISNMNELKKVINNLRNRIQKTKQKIAVGAGIVEENISEEPKLKIMKTDIKLPKDDEDIKQWLSEVYRKRKDMLERRTLRRQRRQDMAKRGTIASQERMRLISQLARKEKNDDDFGIRDEDWDVYKAINKEGGDTDSEEEQEKIIELEEVLKYYDPLFTGSASPNEPINTKEAYQLHLGLEQMRAPEILFQPSMIGSSQAGIAETIEFILKGYSEEISNILANNVFLTGGPTQIPGFLERLNKEMLEMRPFMSTFSLSLATQPSLNAWLGAKKFWASDSKEHYFTYQDYQEKGSDYLKHHFASNMYIPLPAPLPTDSSVENNHTENT